MQRLRVGWKAVLIDDSIEISSDIDCFRISINQEMMLNINRYLKNGTLHFTGDIPFFVEKLINTLNRFNLLTSEPDNVDHKSLQSSYFSHIGLDCKKNSSYLSASKILILGLGGTGSIVLQHLASAGIENFCLVDHDSVDISNLERQLIYNACSVGKLKIDCAEQYIQSISPDSVIRKYKQNITSKNQLHGLLDDIGQIDFCVVCIDEPRESIFSTVSSVLWDRDIPFIHSGVMQRSGFFGPLFSQVNGSSPPSEFKISDKKCGQDTSQRPNIAFSPYNTIISAFMSAEILHFLSGATKLPDYKLRSFFDFSNMECIKIYPQCVDVQN